MKPSLLVVLLVVQSCLDQQNIIPNSGLLVEYWEVYNSCQFLEWWDMVVVSAEVTCLLFDICGLSNETLSSSSTCTLCLAGPPNTIWILSRKWFTCYQLQLQRKCRGFHLVSSIAAKNFRIKACKSVVVIVAISDGKKTQSCLGKDLFDVDRCFFIL